MTQVALSLRQTIGLLIGCCCAFQARGQIRVLAPKTLVSQFPATHGRIEGSTATFGAPFYGDRVMGRLVYGESKGNEHCRGDDYDVQDPEKVPGGDHGSWEEVRLINIIMVKRGKCSFTTKVRVAAEKGAHAVIIVDKQESDLTAADMHKIIVADDGYGKNIHIPSVLISKDDGAKLIESTKSMTPVIVELSWDIPQNQVVVIDLWMSSGSRETQKFMKEFASKRKALNEVMSFQPHYAVFGMPSSDPGVYSGLCLNNRGDYCAEDPDAGGEVTGIDVLEEDVRQLCIHEVTKKPHVAPVQNQKIVQYAAEYWKYVEKFPDRCPLDAPNPQDRFGLECSELVQRKVGIDVKKVRECVLNSKEQKLKAERENQAWSTRALRINGWRYSGMFDADLVTRAVCSGFVKPPRECEDLLRPRDPFVPYNGPPPAAGVSFKTFIAVLGLLIGICVVASMLYKKSLKQSVRTQLREEVMLEVQAQMGEYRQLRGH